MLRWHRGIDTSSLFRVTLIIILYTSSANNEMRNGKEMVEIFFPMCGAVDKSPYSELFDR